MRRTVRRFGDSGKSWDAEVIWVVGGIVDDMQAWRAMIGTSKLEERAKEREEERLDGGEERDGWSGVVVALGVRYLNAKWMMQLTKPTSKAE